MSSLKELCGEADMSVDRPFRSTLRENKCTGSRDAVANHMPPFVHVVAPTRDDSRLLIGRCDPTSGTFVFWRYRSGFSEIVY